jgi:hypothetical protein
MAKKGTIYPTRHSAIKGCAVCLYRVGFGYTTIGKILCRNKALAKKWVVKSGVQIRASVKSCKPNVTRPGFKAKIYQRPIKPDVAEFRKGDERTHWANHPEVRKWDYQRRVYPYQRKYFKTPQQRVIRACRVRTWKTIVGKGGDKQQSWTKAMLGCDRETFLLHLQSQFKRGMNWNNYGRVWEVDHITPCSSFDLTDPEQQRICFHYRNHQPLYKTENRRKSWLIRQPIQQSLLI